MKEEYNKKKEDIIYKESDSCHELVSEEDEDSGGVPRCVCAVEREKDGAAEDGGEEAGFMGNFCMFFDQGFSFTLPRRGGSEGRDEEERERVERREISFFSSYWICIANWSVPARHRQRLSRRYSETEETHPWSLTERTSKSFCLLYPLFSLLSLSLLFFLSSPYRAS